MLKNKKGQELGGIMSLVLTLGAAGIALAVVMLILATMLTSTLGWDPVTNTTTARTNASIALGSTMAAIAQVPAWFGIIVIAVIGAVVLGIVVGAFMYFRRE